MDTVSTGEIQENDDMKDFEYITGVSTLELNIDDCVGCGMCTIVCPHGVLQMETQKARLIDLDSCMECGACALNCPTHAIHVTPGVGCASYIIQTWIKRIKPNSGGNIKCC